MITNIINNDEFNFIILSENEGIIPTSDWNKVKSTYASELAILKTFHENGIARFEEKSLNVGIEEILSLNEFERKIF